MRHRWQEQAQALAHAEGETHHDRRADEDQDGVRQSRRIIQGRLSDCRRSLPGSPCRSTQGDASHGSHEGQICRCHWCRPRHRGRDCATLRRGRGGAGAARSRRGATGRDGEAPARRATAHHRRGRDRRGGGGRRVRAHRRHARADRRPGQQCRWLAQPEALGNDRGNVGFYHPAQPPLCIPVHARPRCG